MTCPYLHKQIVPPCAHRNLKAYRYLNDEEGPFAVMSNKNCLQLFRILHNGLALESKRYLCGNIVKIQIIPSLHHESDFIWAIDELGRQIWFRFGQNSEGVNNDILGDRAASFSEEEDNGQQRSILSGIFHTFEQKNTIGTIFFTINKQIVLQQFVVNKQGLFLGQSFCQSLFPQKQIRFIDWMKHNLKTLHLGFIVQKDQETFLEVYQLKKGCILECDSLTWKFQKKNLLQFYSYENGDVLIMTFDEIALHKYKQNNPLKCFRTRGNYGQGFYLGQGFYGHVGTELVVFSKDKLRSFKGFNFKDQSIFSTGGVAECSCLGKLEKGGNMIGIITHRHQVFLISIFQETSQICQVTQGVYQIESFKPIQILKNKFVVSCKNSPEEHKVLLIQKIKSASIINEQLVPFSIDRLIGTNNGNYVIVGSASKNFVLRLDRNQQYQFYFQLPESEIISASDHLLILSEGVYLLDYQAQKYEQVLQEKIILGQFVDEDVYLLNAQGIIFKWNLEEKLIKVQQNCSQDYCWGIAEVSQTLLCANLERLGEIRLVSQQKVRKIQIKSTTIVSCLTSISPPLRKKILNQNQLILVGFSDGNLHTYIENGQQMHNFSLLCDNFVKFTRISQQKMILFCGDRQYQLTYLTQYPLIEQIMLSNQPSSISQIVYSKKLNKFIFVEQTSCQFFRESHFPEQTLYSTRMTTLLTSDSPPLILTQEEQVLICTPNKINVINIKNCKATINEHKMSTVSFMDSIELGILVIGKDSNDQKTLILLNSQLQLLCTHILPVKQPLYSIKAVKSSNNFIMASHQNLSLYEITPSHQLQLLSGIKINSHPHQIDIHPFEKLILVNDVNNYLSIFRWSHVINLIDKFVPANQVQKCCFSGKDILISDDKGNLKIIALLADQWPNAQHTAFSQRSQLYLGEQMQSFCQVNNELSYITNNLSIYCIKPIERQHFDLLHRLEEQNLALIKKTKELSYEPWRMKSVQDKLIDVSLVKILLNHPEHPLISEFAQPKWRQLMEQFIHS